MIKILFYFLVAFISLKASFANTKIDCSLYDPERVSEYTSSWMGNDQYYLFENCGSETDFYVLGAPSWIKNFMDQDWLYKNSEFDYIGDKEGDNKKDYKLLKEKPLTTNSWSNSELGLGFFYCDTQNKQADFDGDGIGDIYISSYFGGNLSSSEGAFLSVGKKEVIGYHDSSGELGNIWCDVNQNGIAEFRRVGQLNNPTQVFVEFDPKQSKFVEVTLQADLAEKFKLEHEIISEKKPINNYHYGNANDFPDWIKKWKEITFDTYDKCSTIEPLDTENFLIQNKVNIPKSYDPFFYWYLAEDAANKKFEGKYDNKLVLQLICMGGGSKTAIETAYENTLKLWKSNKPMHFNICEVVTSGLGATICAGRDSDKFNNENSNKIESFRYETDYIIHRYIVEAYEKAERYFNKKAINEESHYGTGYGAWVAKSIMKHKEQYTNRIEILLSGKKDFYREYDHETKEMILKVLFETISNNIFDGKNQKLIMLPPEARITLKEFNEVHELWLDYLYSTSVMYHKIDPYVTINQWQAFLIDERINDLVHSFYLSRDLQIFY